MSFEMQALTAAMLNLTRAVSDTAARLGSVPGGAVSDPSRAMVDELKQGIADVFAQHRGTLGGDKNTAIDSRGRVRAGGYTNGGDIGQRDATASEKLALKIGSSVGSAFMSIGSVLTSRFVTVLGPLAALGTVVSSATSGFSVLFSSMKVLASAVLPLLLPVVVAVATALNHMGDVLWGKVSGALGDWASAILETLIPAFQALVDVVEWLAEKMSQLGSQIPRFKGTAEERKEREQILGTLVKKGYISAETASTLRNGKSSREIIDMVPPELRAMIAADAGGTAPRGAFGRLAAGVAGAGGGSEGGVSGVSMSGGMAKSFSEVVRELRISSGPAASFSDITGISRSAQLAASNASPFESKQLERLDKILTTLEMIEAKSGGSAITF